MRRVIRSMLGCVAAVAVLVAGAAAEDVTLTYTPGDPDEVATVAVRGSFSDWGEITMLPRSDGTWSVTVDLPPGEHEYKYYINGIWPRDMEMSLTGSPFDPQADGYVSDGYGGQNAIRVIGGSQTGAAGARRPHSYLFKEKVLSENESLLEIDPRLREGGTAASASMRLMYDVHHLCVQKGFKYVIIHYREAESTGASSFRVEFLNVAPAGYEVVDLMNPGPERELDPDSLLFDAAGYIEFWDSQMTRPREPPGATAGTGPVMGYRLEDGEVVFEFRTADYQVVTRGSDGVPFDIAGVGIDIVAVAGEFNNWSTHAWPMSKRVSGVYEVRKAIDLFSGRPEWQFKFVINGLYWVEPPESAPNRGLADPLSGPVNLVLTLK